MHEKCVWLNHFEYFLLVYLFVWSLIILRISPEFQCTAEFKTGLFHHYINPFPHSKYIKVNMIWYRTKGEKRITVNHREIE